MLGERKQISICLRYIIVSIKFKFMDYQVIPLLPEDFSWTRWTIQDIELQAHQALVSTTERLSRLKALAIHSRTVENTLSAFDSAFGDLWETTWKMDFLMNVSPDAELRKAAQLWATKLGQDSTDLQYDEELYRALKEFESLQLNLDAVSAKLLKDILRDFKRLGFELNMESRQRLQEHTKQLQDLSAKFGANANNWEDFIVVAPSEAEGLSATYLSNLKRDNDGNYIVTIKYPDYFPFVETAVNAQKRKELMDKFFCKAGVQNIELLTEAVALRKKIADLLGYGNFVEYTTETRMAKTGQAVKSFIDEVIQGVRPLLAAELEEMSGPKRQETDDFATAVEYWDIAYKSNELLKNKYGIDNEKIKEYFPLDFVLESMFSVYSELFSVNFERLTSYPLWHEDVQFYSVKDNDGSLRAYFALDLHPREGKYGHAAEFPLRIGRFTPAADKAYAPFACMVTNFPKSTTENPSLMPHSQVQTLFHEFGHVMHENLSLNKFFSQSGTIVSRDFVEAPSQMLEYWVWEPGIIKRLSRHYLTGESMPDELIQKLVASKNHGAGWFNMRQMVLALFDYRLHTEDANPIQLFAEVWRSLLSVNLPSEQMYPAGFGHLMNGYEASYYSYMWSRVYAADMFSRFAQEGVLNAKTGMEYRQKVLSIGSSRDELDSVRDFLGRDISTEAFLKELGI